MQWGYMNRRIKIGVCTAVINQLSMHRMMGEFCREATKRGFELHIFAPFSNLDYDTNNDRIQQEIYRFLEYEKPEAIVCFADMVKVPSVRDSILAIAKKMDIPVIGVKSAIDGMYNINYDVDGAIRQIISHLIEEHHCSKINFISGNKDDVAFDFRLKAYIRTLEKHNIEIDNNRILYGGFWGGPTREALDEYFAKGFEMPDAFVCANDAMAIAVCKYLREKGYDVPKDVKVTGIGGISETELFSPELTTAKYDPKITSNCICDVLEGMLKENKFPERTIRIPCEINFTESCGCPTKEKQEHNETISGLFTRLEKEREFRHDINGMIVAINDECVIDTVLEYLPKYIEPVGVKAYGLYLVKKFADMVGVPSFLMGDDYPLILLGNYINDENSKLIKPISIKECDDSLSAIAGEDGHVIMIPIHSDKELFGFIAVNYDEARIAPEFLYELCVIINLSFDALYKRYNLDIANRQLREVSEQIIISLAEVVEYKSEVTGQHIKRVSEYTRILASGLGLSDEETNLLRVASMMHDVGKINIPSSILDKPGKLTAEEFDVIKTHVTVGEKLMEKAPGEMMEKARVIAKQHHEKWNGKGYLGMKGREIDIAARIVALADVFDALVSKRPYKDAFPIEKAVQIIVEDRGEHFDPCVVDCFIANLDEFVKTKESYSDL